MEIERKFLVLNQEYKKLGSPEAIVQGYLNSDKNRTVRVRIQGSRAKITIKSATVGISREEFEYDIPFDDAKIMLYDLCEKPIIEKNRYTINYQGSIWEVDEFLGENTGLIVAEIELESPEALFNKPEWIGDEVSYDPKYFNSSLIKNPFKNW
ncbi:CYTH domain-containing protein [Leptospira sp. FAT2]|uniref:CYTH domain-containing protein n=1 Tax=Leptospira sanjuanensis TaxID=2879643 RepID=UPI001EE80B85|nr:CYTH domain-containing protein [Leptospira sanjuanensis]MCG6192307.1 CYTH domain-containing protein [Leptospira sanjuanensis]